MARKKRKKNSESRELKKEVSDVLVVNEKNLKPYIELLNVSPENITQKPLGNLLGIFEIKDTNKDSAYIVNFLSSVAKKEYFINPKRPVTESLETSLHKINLALSELAKHGNIDWLGKLDSAICVLEKNTLHFSVAGNAKVLLIRNGNITDISDGLAPPSNKPFPMKTFVNVSSGQLEEKDKIVITTDDIFHIFSTTELEKSALGFSREKFIQFLRTALVNELDIAGTFIVDISKDDMPVKRPKKSKGRSEKNFNAFSGKSYARTKAPYLEEKELPQTKTADKKSAEGELPKKKKDEDFTDKRTGHIYVKGSHLKPEERKPLHQAKNAVKEKCYDFFCWLKSNVAKKSAESVKEIGIKAKSFAKEKRLSGTKFLKDTSSEISSKISRKNFKSPFERPDDLKIQSPTENLVERPKKIGFSQIKSLFGKLIPNFSIIKTSASRMSNQQKLYAALMLLLIILVPLFLGKIKNYQQKKSSDENIAQDVVSQDHPFSDDKNASRIDSVSTIYSSDEDILEIIKKDGETFLITSKKIVVFEEEKEKGSFNFDDNFGESKLAAFMSDLNLIFLLTEDNRLISFSSISRKFNENSIEIPDDSDIKALGTYLTYIYLVDAKNSQIYRYPRAEGGFGEKTDWLREDADFENVHNISIDENIYLSNQDNIMKLFQNKAQDFNTEQSSTQIKFNNIYTSKDLENIYTLDSENGRIVKFSKDGLLLSQQYSEDLIEAKNLFVDEVGSKIYVGTRKDKLISFSF